MKTLDEVIAILRDLKAEAGPLFSVQRFGLFGWYARNQQSDQSDLDLLVELERPVPFSAFCRLEDIFSERMGGRRRYDHARRPAPQDRTAGAHRGGLCLNGGQSSFSTTMRTRSMRSSRSRPG